MGKSRDKKKRNFNLTKNIPFVGKNQKKVREAMEKTGVKRSLEEAQTVKKIEDKQKRVNLDNTFKTMTQLSETSKMMGVCTEDDESTDYLDLPSSACPNLDETPMLPSTGAIRKSAGKSKQSSLSSSQESIDIWPGSEKKDLVNNLQVQNHSVMLARQIQTSIEIIGSEVISQIVMEFTRPMSSEEFEVKAEVAVSNLLYCQAGYLRGQEESKKSVYKEIKDLKLSIKDLKKTMEEHIKTLTENTAKLQAECTSVSSDFRKMLSKMEALQVHKTSRKDPNLQVYHPVTTLKENVCNFMLDGKSCSIIQQDNGEISCSIVRPKRMGVDVEVLKIFGGTLKKMSPGIFSAIRDREIKDLLLEFVDSWSPESEGNPEDIMKTILSN